jgi:ATP-dependent DNA helicase RecG
MDTRNRSESSGLPVEQVPGVGPKRAVALREAGLGTVEDLLFHLPLRYEDKRRPMPLPAVPTGERRLHRLKITAVKQGRSGRGGRLHRLEATAEDRSGTAVTLRWFNQRFRLRGLSTDTWYCCFGKTGASGHDGPGLVMDNPELMEDPDPASPLSRGPHLGRIVPVYRRLGPIGSTVLRGILFRLLEETALLPGESQAASMLLAHGFPGRLELFRGIHDPPGRARLDLLNHNRSIWHRGLALEELYLQQEELSRRRAARLSTRKRPEGAGQPENGEMLVGQVERLTGFTLTDEQRAAVEDVDDDLRQPWPMRRLLQGEVGCGKTVVAYAALVRAAAAGEQAALMAPTEALAWQHHRRLDRMLRSLDQKDPLRPLAEQTILVTGGADARNRRQRDRLATGDALIAIGTHALLSASVTFRDLSLAVVDEQQRFGVGQREQLRSKGANPDLLVISATPIPRTMGLRLCGDMELSRIRELPRGRREVKTLCLAPDQSAEALDILERELDSGCQGFVVCPTVRGGDGGNRRAAETVFRRFGSGALARHRAELLHGGMALDQAREVMERFQRGESRLLVTTTVVEVGLDVPRATVMVVLEPERFGLSQLHQLRGRVGRGNRPGTFILLRSLDDTESEAGRRLAVLDSSDDGFHIAEEDLRLRGSGELTGERQAGAGGHRVAAVVDGAGRLLDLARGAAFHDTGPTTARDRGAGTGAPSVTTKAGGR